MDITSNMQTNSLKHLSRQARGRAGKIRIGLWLLMSFLGLALIAFAIAIFGQVNGEEFCPQRFTMRQFSYLQIPLLRIQVWPVKFNKITGTEDALANHIRRSTRKNGLMNQVRTSKIRWDIVTLQETGRSTYRGDASILTNYLRQRDAAGMESWLDWSKANPQLANELWGIVGQLANQDLYPIIPDVLEAARRLDASNFAAQLKRIVVQECQAFAKAHTAAGDTQRAAAVAKFAKQMQLPNVTAETEDVSKEEL